MISNVTSLIRSAFSTFVAGNATVSNPNASSARRVGPSRVIFTARLNGMDGSMILTEISLGIPFRDFLPGKAVEELVTVLVDQAGNQAEAAPLLEKRATLKVKPDTKFLSVTFIGCGDRVYKSERIKIK